MHYYLKFRVYFFSKSFLRRIITVEGLVDYFIFWSELFYWVQTYQELLGAILKLLHLGEVVQVFTQTMSVSSDFSPTHLYIME